MRPKEVISWLSHRFSPLLPKEIHVYGSGRENLGCYWRFKIDYLTKKGSDIKNIMSWFSNKFSPLPSKEIHVYGSGTEKI